jgi:glycosyltransferase involved in cell wall biosynthesis
MEEQTRPAALVLAPETPYPTVGGGALRSASVLEYLTRRYDVDLVVFREPGSPDPAIAVPRHRFRELLVLELPRHSRALPARVVRNLGRAFRGVSPLVDRFAGFDSPIAAFLGGRRYGLAVIEHLWCAPYWEQVAPRCDKAVLNLHNVESVLMERSALVESWPVAGLYRRFAQASLESERRWLPRYDLTLAASASDAALLRSRVPSASILVYRNALVRVPAPDVPRDHAIAFSGNFEYHPNRDAVRYFQTRIWPLVRARWPGLVWRLIGKNPGAVRGLLSSDPCIELCGSVDNAIEALARAKAVVVPLRTGSGTRLKILEAWAAARPIVSTSIGAEGLSATDGVHLLLGDTPEVFAGAVARLLESDELRTRIGRDGRALYEREYTWESAWDDLRAAEI